MAYYILANLTTVEFLLGHWAVVYADEMRRAQDTEFPLSGNSHQKAQWLVDGMSKVYNLDSDYEFDDW